MTNSNVTATKADPRYLALQTLNRIDTSAHSLDTIIEKILLKHPELDRRDRALLYAIVYGVLRWRGRLDWIISNFSKTPLRRIEPAVLNILRMGLFQIFFLERIPQSAAVNTAVQLAKTVSSARVAPFVNAVLRNAIRGASGGRPHLPAPDTDPANAMAIDKSFPRWLIDRWIKRYGVQGTMAICDSMNTIPPITIRTNSLKISQHQLMTELAPYVSEIGTCPFAPSGINIQGPTLPIDRIPAFEKGGFQVQDEAAQLISHLLNPLPGDHVIDACCGLGGKTGHIAALMENKGEIIALDSIQAKLDRLNEEMKRLGITIVETSKADLMRPQALENLPVVDKILLDAPCSGLGVIRRNPDAKWRAAKKNLKRFHDRQLVLLNHLARKIKPGGKLVYVVCSMEPEENEAVINTFLKKRTDFVIEKNSARLPAVVRPFITKTGFFRTSPGQHRMDGFFSTVLKHLS